MHHRGGHASPGRAWGKGAGEHGGQEGRSEGALPRGETSTSNRNAGRVWMRKVAAAEEDGSRRGWEKRAAAPAAHR